MKNCLIICFVLVINTLNAQNKPLNEHYQRLPFGAIKPTGWLKTQMQKDMAGFVGNLDKLVPSLINDPIYAQGRLQKHSKTKDLGNLKSGDMEGEDQYKWWNSETQSNWWDGYIRNAFLLDDKQALEKVKTHVQNILATQDADGYLGIYDKELRYHFSAENGELWSKASLYRGLLAYFEATNDPKVWTALTKAIDNLMTNYPLSKSQPFFAGNGFTGGVSHGLTITDVFDRLYQLTGDRKYWDYAAFLYLNFSENHASEKDAQLKNIMDATYKLQSHGVHTYEHIRPLIVSAYASGSDELQKALSIYVSKIKKTTTMVGGATGDEWISKQIADATHTGYEYCSLHELMDSYAVLLQKSGKNAVADDIENIFYNAAQGSRNPENSSIAYLKTDNSYEMLGTKNGEIEPNRKQIRYKYSPAHQDVAVCCNPNAGRITPYFVQSAWLKEGDNTLVAALLCPNILETKLKDAPLSIEVQTEYPYQNQFVFKIKTHKEMDFSLKIRKPNWVKSIVTNEKYRIENDCIVIERIFKTADKIELKFTADVQIKEDLNHEKYFFYGALAFAKPIAATAQKGKIYTQGFEDMLYTPIDNTQYEFMGNNKAVYKKGKISVVLKNKKTQKNEKLNLIPIGKTILRQASF
jgi:uncharacterized protein